MITKSRQHAASWALLVPYSIFPQNTGGRPPTAQQYIIEIINQFPSYNPCSTLLQSVADSHLGVHPALINPTGS